MLSRLPVLGVKLAVTLAAALKVTLQFPVPVHAPPQLAKVLPAAAVSESVIGVLAGKVAEQVGVEQLIPAGVLVTVPLPSTVTVKA